MTTKQTAPLKVTGKPQAIAPNTDILRWTNDFGGSWSTAANWSDTTTGTAAASAPGTSNVVFVAGNPDGEFTAITGTGAAAQLSMANKVLLLGTLSVAGAVTLQPIPGAFAGASDVELDGGAKLTAASLTSNNSLLEMSNGSTLAVAGGVTLSDTSLLALGGSTVQLGSLVANIVTGYASTVIAVDDNSSIEVGTTGGAALGAITIDKGMSAAVRGAIDGNLVINGTLSVQAGGELAIDGNDPFGTAQSIGGSGTLAIGQNSFLSLGVADTAAIQFAGPSGRLSLAALPGGTISGFVAGNSIQFNGLATSLSYRQTTSSLATLTLMKGSKAAGTLKLAGNYAGSAFHLSVSSNGAGTISVQTIGAARVQPKLIAGTPGQDTLYATANQQTLTGLGGGDILQGGTFTAITFKDTSAGLNNSTIASFDVSDVIDLTDLKPGTATVSYTPGNTPANYYQPATYPTLTVTDGARTVSTMINFGTSNYGYSVPPIGYFTVGSDGAAGTNVKFVIANSDAYLFAILAGGSFGTPSNWQDSAANAPAILAPSYGNAVTIAGGLSANTLVTGNGVAASLATSGNVLLKGSFNIGSRIIGVSSSLIQAGTLALDSGAALTLASAASIGGVVTLGGASKLTSAGGLTFAADGASLVATAGSSIRFASAAEGLAPTVLAEPWMVPQWHTAYSVVSVDAASSIEFGLAGNAAAGALTIDNGVTEKLSGTIDGNLVVNGTLTMADGSYSLTIGPFGAVAPSVSGAGTLVITAGATLTLGGSDSAAIQFTATAETLMLAGDLPTGKISGFANGDMISVAQIVTGLTYSQSGGTAATLTLLSGNALVGTLSLAGSYAGSLFNLSVNQGGVGGVITVQPGQLTGTAGAGTLVATANNQTLTGLGGNDTLDGGAFVGLDFKDLTANLNGSSVLDFARSDIIDFTDMTAGSTTVKYAANTLRVTDGTHTASLGVSFGANLPTTGAFHVSSDGGAGAKLTWS